MQNRSRSTGARFHEGASGISNDRSRISRSSNYREEMQYQDDLHGAEMLVSFVTLRQHLVDSLAISYLGK